MSTIVQLLSNEGDWILQFDPDTGKTVVYQLFRNVLGLASYKFCLL